MIRGPLFAGRSLDPRYGIATRPSPSPNGGSARDRRTTRHALAQTPAAAPALRVLPPPEARSGDLKNPALYINRELSWLEFNERVLAQALDPSHPLLERVKFLAIVATNLDEFFMIRVSTTQKKLREGIEDVAPDGYNTEQQLEAMRARALRMLQDQAACWNELRTLLAAEHITLLEAEHWTPEIREYLGAYFSREICPVLTPLAFDPGHPFPLISNLSKNFAVVVRHGGRTKFARVKVPDVLPRFVPIPESLSAAAGHDVRLPRGRHPRQHARALSRHAGARARTCSASSATPTSRSSRTRPTTCSRRSTAA